MITAIGNYIGKKRNFSWSTYWRQLLSAPNSDIVYWNGLIDVPITGASFFQAFYDSSLTEGMYLIDKYKGERVTGSRSIIKIQIHNITTTEISNVIISAWRYDGSTYNKIYTEDVLLKLSSVNQVHTIILASAWELIEGDFIGIFWRKSTVNNVDIAAAIAQTLGSRYKVNLNYNTTPYEWDSLGTNNNNYVPIRLLGQAPMIVGIGDSLMESYPLHTSMPDVARTTVDPTKSWLYKLYNSDNRFIYQNCGIGAETTTLIEARFNRDVVLKKPKIAIINGGINDLDTGGTEAVFLAKWTSIFDMCVVADIIPIVWKMMPWTNGSNAQMQTRDAWNASLTTLFNSYTIKGKQLMDWDALLGEFRVGGDAGNLWNLKAAYDQGDGVHLNEAGQALLASTVLALFS